MKALAPLLLLGCTRSDPPGLSQNQGVVTTGHTPVVEPAPMFDAGRAQGAVVIDVDSGTDGGDVHESGALPQTEERPPQDDPKLRERLRILFDAIVDDAPDRALPLFFPASAYAQVKDIPDPKGDWNSRLVRAFRRDVHALHKSLAGRSVTFEGISVDEKRVRWVKPHEELNRIGYYRVYGTRILYKDGERARHLDITSLISWRGTWYVVHLSGFK